jgi:hypothetical protein
MLFIEKIVRSFNFEFIRQWDFFIILIHDRQCSPEMEHSFKIVLSSVSISKCTPMSFGDDVRGLSWRTVLRVVSEPLKNRMLSPFCIFKLAKNFARNFRLVIYIF